MGLTSGTTASKHGQLPETRVKGGRSPILPAVWPLARVPNAPLWWSLAVVQINPAWSPMKALLVQCAGSCVELKQAPFKRFCAPLLKQLLDCALQSWATHMPTTPKMPLARTVLANASLIRPFALATWKASGRRLRLRLGFHPTMLWPSPISPHHGLGNRLGIDLVASKSSTMGIARHRSRSFLMRSSIFCVMKSGSDWSAQHIDALRMPCIISHFIDILGNHTCWVPSFGLPLMQVDSCVPQQGLL